MNRGPQNRLQYAMILLLHGLPARAPNSWKPSQTCVILLHSFEAVLRIFMATARCQLYYVPRPLKKQLAGKSFKRDAVRDSETPRKEVVIPLGFPGVSHLKKSIV